MMKSHVGADLNRKCSLKFYAAEKNDLKITNSNNECKSFLKKKNQDVLLYDLQLILLQSPGFVDF
jgi:hypothetical protein